MALSCFSSFSHFAAVLASCFAVNLRLKIWSSSLSSRLLNQLLKSPILSTYRVPRHVYPSCGVSIDPRARRRSRVSSMGSVEGASPPDGSCERLQGPSARLEVARVSFGSFLEKFWSVAFSGRICGYILALGASLTATVGDGERVRRGLKRPNAPYDP